MKADLTRLTFDKAKHYRAVQQQQGRVQLDSDWNEQNDIAAHRIETETVDVVGHCGAPLHADGFRLVPNAAALTAAETAREENKNPPPFVGANLLLTGGRFYAGGVLAENDRICLASTQPDLPSAADTTKVGGTNLFPLSAPGTWLAYLDVWPRLRTAIDDPHIREVALGGPDTATRTKNAWQVKFLPAPDGANCSTAIPAWTSLLDPKPGTLAASVKTVPDKTGPCIVDPGSGYRRLENQLYRVEVHTGGASLAGTTFKWSRDNGSIVSRWLGQSAVGEISVETTGRDKVLNLAASHWIELTDDAHEELGLPGVFAQIATVNGNLLTLASPSAAMDFAKFPKNPKVRRWESAPATAGKWITPDGTSVNLNTTDKFELEDGVVVEFGSGSFRTGDYWLIPARTALPQVDWPSTGPANAPVPTPLPPHGVTHHYCKLAIVEFKAGVFKISDCRHLFPPLTELTELSYVSGDSQEATPNPTLPATTLLPLALPLKVGVANGEWPVAGARVRFTVKVGGGTLTPANGIVFTGADGIASCAWSINSTAPNPEVIAELLDSADARVSLPVIFHARLNTAKLVSYDPKNCEGMKNAAPPVVTVQDALDFLCHEKSGVDCCVTVGKLDDRPGDYDTIAEALEDLLIKRQWTSVCLSLLPGDHVIDKPLTVGAAEDKTQTFFKIAGCSHASRLMVKAPLLFVRLAGVVIRDIAIGVDGGRIEFSNCSEVEISRCIVKGRVSGDGLMKFTQVPELALVGNLIRATSDDTKAAAPEKVLKSVAGLEAAYKLADDQDFEKAAATIAQQLVELPAAERAKLAKELTAEIKKADTELSTEAKKTYTEMVRTLGTERPTAKTLTSRLQSVRTTVAVATTGAGTALAFADFLGAVSLTDNVIAGIVSFGGTPTTKTLTAAELKAFGDQLKQGAIDFGKARSGSLQLRANEILQFVAGDLFIAALKELIKAGKGPLELWSSAHLTDNTIHEGGNFFAARHVSLSTTRFLEVEDVLGIVIGSSSTYVGNSADNDVILRNFTAKPRAEAANQGLSIQG